MKRERGCKPRKIYGQHTVAEHLRAAPHSVQELYLLPALRDSSLDLMARQSAIRVRYEPPSFFAAFSPAGAVHQGVVALLHALSYVSLDHIITQGADLLLILDSILDPRNLGALLRSAEAAGVGGIVLPKDRSAPLSSVAEKTAAGATAYLSICQVTNLVRALVTVKQAGYWLVGLAPNASLSLYDLPLSRQQKIALLLGGEEKGLRPLIQRQCDYLIAIPMRGKIQSLNVSTAGAVALYECVRKRLPARRALDEGKGNG
jgi:23S rRNA (guanosine2251-2'-O)-methyltransferase